MSLSTESSKKTPGSQLAAFFNQLHTENFGRAYTFQRPKDSVIFKRLCEEFGLDKAKRLVQLLFEQTKQPPTAGFLTGNGLTRLLNTLPIDTTYTIIEQTLNTPNTSELFKQQREQFLRHKYGKYKTLADKLSIDDPSS